MAAVFGGGAAQRLNGLAFVPFAPASTGKLPAQLRLVVAASDEEVQRGLRQSKVLLLPADYESFGFAQAEALALGCCVPVLGEWPLWQGIQELDWRGLCGQAIAAQLRQLLAVDQRWVALQRQQAQLWCRRPERQAPLWT